MIREKVPTLVKPKRQDFICYKGQSWNRNLRFKVGKNKTTLDMTGWTAKAEIRPDENSETLSADLHAQVTGAEGMVSLALTAEESAELWDGAYYWDIYTVRPNGKKQVWLYGKFYVKGRVTV